MCLLQGNLSYTLQALRATGKVICISRHHTSGLPTILYLALVADVMAISSHSARLSSARTTALDMQPNGVAHDRNVSTIADHTITLAQHINRWCRGFLHGASSSGPRRSKTSAPRLVHVIVGESPAPASQFDLQDLGRSSPRGGEKC